MSNLKSFRDNESLIKITEQFLHSEKEGFLLLQSLNKISAYGRFKEIKCCFQGTKKIMHDILHKGLFDFNQNEKSSGAFKKKKERERERERERDVL